MSGQSILRIISVVLLQALLFFELFAVQSASLRWYEWIILVLLTLGMVISIIGECSASEDEKLEMDIDNGYIFIRIINFLILCGLLWKTCNIQSELPVSFSWALFIVLGVGLFAVFNFVYYLIALLTTGCVFLILRYAGLEGFYLYLAIAGIISIGIGAMIRIMNEMSGQSTLRIICVILLQALLLLELFAVQSASLRWYEWLILVLLTLGMVISIIGECSASEDQKLEMDIDGGYIFVRIIYFLILCGLLWKTCNIQSELPVSFSWALFIVLGVGLFAVFNFVYYLITLLTTGCVFLILKHTGFEGFWLYLVIAGIIAISIGTMIMIYIVNQDKNKAEREVEGARREAEEARREVEEARRFARMAKLDAILARREAEEARIEAEEARNKNSIISDVKDGATIINGISNILRFFGF